MTTSVQQSVSERRRTFETALEIGVPIDQVWAALTEAEELVRWFPLQARVIPGPGGTMQWSWDGDWTWETTIEAWEPPRRLRLVQEGNRPFDAEGKQLPDEIGPESMPLVLEIEPTARGGITLLRLVHSGFGAGSSWDDEFDGISAGWQFELRGLRHYLEGHRGRDRRFGWARIATSEPRDRVWRWLLSDEGFAVEAAALELGRPYSAAGARADGLTGEIELYLPERELFGTVRELDGGVFRLSTHRAGGRTGVTVWLSSYRGHVPEVESFGERARQMLQRRFPDGRVK